MRSPTFVIQVHDQVIVGFSRNKGRTANSTRDDFRGRLHLSVYVFTWSVN